MHREYPELISAGRVASIGQAKNRKEIAMRRVILMMAAAVASALPGASANAAPVPAPLSAAAQAVTATESVRDRNYWSRNYAYEAPWRHVRRPLGTVPPPVGGGGGDSFSTGRGTGGGDTASNGTAAYWGTNGHAYSGF
jgi:hypothetical protein